MDNTPKKGRRARKIVVWAACILVAALTVFVYVRFYFVFGEGVKSGQLNNFMYKGYVFKTYEGLLIQSGYRSASGTIQSNQFEFSVTDPEVAAELEKYSGKVLDLHYKQYLGRLPWRGMQNQIVDRIERVHSAPAQQQAPPVEFPAANP